MLRRGLPLKIDSRRGSLWVGNHVAAGGEVGLLFVPFRHLAAETFVERFDVTKGRLVKVQFAIGYCRQGFASQIVLGGPQATGHDHDISSLARVAKDAYAIGDTVSYRRVKRDFDTRVAKSLADPPSVSVQSLSGRHLVTDRDDFCSQLLHGVQ